ncbi:MAG: integrase core domain-containing protein, partial [Candidatus Bathyarchaeia archaeon]
GGKSVDKLDYLNRAIFGPLNTKLIHIPKGKKEYNAFVERSHQTDDNEFYIPQLELCKDLTEFLFRALRWEYVYNTIRVHSGIGMTPYKKLCQYVTLPKMINLFPVFIIDKTIPILRTFFPKGVGGYYVLTKDPLFYSQTSRIELGLESTRRHGYLLPRPLDGPPYLRLALRLKGANKVCLLDFCGMIYYSS